MSEHLVYLDSSAIVKRYVQEPSSDTIREKYLKAYSGEVSLACSLWNIGEVLGVFDRARRIGRLSNGDYIIAKRRFLSETKRLIKLGVMIIVP